MKRLAVPALAAFAAFAVLTIAQPGHAAEAPPAHSMPMQPMHHAPKMLPADVQQLQEALNKAGAHLKVDGHWGAKSRAALRHFQHAHGLPATGHPDPETVAKLQAAG